MGVGSSPDLGQNAGPLSVNYLMIAERVTGVEMVV
jgi:hypothetical protein